MRDYLNELFLHFAGTCPEHPREEEANKLRQELSEALPKEQRILLLTLCNIIDSARCVECYDCFTAGLRLGVGMMAQLDQPGFVS